MMKVAGITYESIVDGPGVRIVLFLQGCNHGCYMCHNPDSHPLDGGETLSVIEVYNRIIARKQRLYYIKGITLSGGEPFLQAKELVQLVNKLKCVFPMWDVVTYTGYTFEELMKMGSDAVQLLSITDILVDGPYIHSLSDGTLKFCGSFRGSSNQRVIDIKATFSQNSIGSTESHRPILYFR